MTRYDLNAFWRRRRRNTKQLGVPPTQAAGGLAALLPAVIDKLTPNRQSVSGPELQNNIAGLLKGGAGGLGLGDLAKLFGK